MKVRVRLETIRDIRDFTEITSKLDTEVSLSDGEEMRVNAKSLIGAMYTTEWDNVYCESKVDITKYIERFIY